LRRGYRKKARPEKLLIVKDGWTQLFRDESTGVRGKTETNGAEEMTWKQKLIRRNVYLKEMRVQLPRDRPSHPQRGMKGLQS